MDMNVKEFTCDLEVACSVGIVLVEPFVAVLLPRSKRLDVERKCELMLGLKYINRETLGRLTTRGLHTDDGCWG